jgi:hypothetical protein
MRALLFAVTLLFLVAAAPAASLAGSVTTDLGERSVVRESSNLAGNDDFWLPCCSGGFASMSPAD